MSQKTLKFNHGLTADARKRLLEHFSGEGPSANDRWAALWDDGSFLPWDRGTPSPALKDALEQHPELFGSSIFIKDPFTGEHRRKRALVPGCGRGYDVLLLASFGYDAYGLEISSTAVKRCHEFAENYKDEYPVKDTRTGAGKVTFLEGDFFGNGWLKLMDGGQTFELFYDYTVCCTRLLLRNPQSLMTSVLAQFLCALHPSMRPQWALRYSQLVSPHPDARLICLEFPTYKEPSTGGPPFGVAPPVYVAHLGHPGAEPSYDSEGNLVSGETSPSGEGGFQRMAHWQAERTHEVGKGTDWVSVWKVV